MHIRLSCRPLLVCFFAAALGFASAPEQLRLGGIAVAYADDDDDGGGGGGGWSGGGSERSAGKRQRGKNPRFLRFLRQQFSTGRPNRSGRPASRSASRASQELAAAPNEIVALGATPGQVDLLTSAGFGLAQRVRIRAGDGGELLRLRPPRGQSLDAAIAQAQAIAPQAAFDRNHFYRPNSDCGGRPCVAPGLVGWPAALQTASACRGDGVAIGLIDTGINSDHPTFAGGNLEVVELEGNPPSPSDRQHGTAVAALLIGRAAGATPGLLPDARLVAVDAFEREGGEAARADTFDLARALEVLASRNVDVINMSLAGPANAVLERLIRDVHARDIVLVAAAGNGGPRAKPLFPAGYPQVIAVTAVDRQLQLYRRAAQGSHIDIAAPGVGVWTAASVRGSRQRTGTSFAAPFVAAAAALAKSSGSGSPQDVERQLTTAAVDLGDPGKDDAYGWGLLDASRICGAGQARP